MQINSATLYMFIYGIHRTQFIYGLVGTHESISSSLSVCIQLLPERERIECISDNFQLHTQSCKISSYFSTSSRRKGDNFGNIDIEGSYIAQKTTLE